MTIPNPAIKFTYEDYRHTPDDKRYELLDGDLIMAPAPNLGHQDVAAKLGWRVMRFVEQRNLGKAFPAPCDVVLSNTDVVQPDLLFVSRERAHILLGGDNVQGAPDLVVEILSPSTASRDKTLKRSLYARHGVLEYWLVDPNVQTVDVMVLGDGGLKTVAVYGKDQTLTSPMLEGLAVDLDEIF